MIVLIEDKGRKENGRFSALAAPEIMIIWIWKTRTVRAWIPFERRKKGQKNMAKVSEQTSGCVREDSECEASGKECLYLCVRAYMPLGRRSMQSTDA